MMKSPVPDDLNWQVEAARYHSAEFAQLERERVFERAWLVAAAGCRLRKPGEYLATDVLGHPLLVVRGSDGRVRAFANSCLHRGTRLAEGWGRADCIRCPYHGWTYALDGRLSDVPAREGIRLPSDLGTLRLHEFATAEALGLVWVSLCPNPPDLVASLHTIPDELAPYRLDEMRPIEERRWEVGCNWKALLENAAESYHIPHVHPSTIERNVREQPDFQRYGDHIRQSLAIAPWRWRRWIDRITSRGGPYTARQWDALQKYWLFPNTLINVIPCHLTIFQAWPLAPDRCLFFYGFYGRSGALPPEWLRARASWLFSRWVLREDMAVLRKFQSGAIGGHVRTHRFHRGEIAAAHLHATLNRWIGPAAA